jgi:hypothetical protein
MVKSSVATYLKQDGKSLGKVLVKLNQLKQWNGWLSDCLTEETILLEHCQIVGINRDALIVIADSAHWLTRFRFHIPTLLVKLRHYPDFNTLKAICCKVRPQHHAAASQKATGRRLSLSKANAAALQGAANKIEDKKLKAILEKMARYAEEKAER